MDTLVLLLYSILSAPKKWWMDIESGHNTEVFQAKASQHYTLVFTAFVCMTLFNEINARKVHDEPNVFEGIHRNHLFLIIWFATFAAQVRSTVQFSTCRLRHILFYSTRAYLLYYKYSTKLE